VPGDILGYGANTCLLGFGKYSGLKYILGDVFLRNYYSVYDYDNYQIGLIPNGYTSATMV
jgi:hypothetical protein